jgi:hypothetical protein
MNQIIFLFFIVVLAIGIPYFFNISEYIEGFSNYTLDRANGNYPAAQTDVLVQDTYPAIGKNQVSDESGEKMWQKYPVYELGSYEQKTNNIRYPDNPDDGRCTPANFCNALYKNKNIGSNIIKPLPQINPECGTRVGYFDTDSTLMAFRTNMQNILY